MFCKYCGAKLPDGSKFCGSCGKSLVADGAQGGAAPKGSVGQGQRPNMQAGPQGSYQSAPGRGTVNNYAYAKVPTAGKMKKEFTPGNIGYWVGCLIAVIAVFMDYVSSMGVSISLTGLASEEESVMILVVMFLIIPIVGAVLNAAKLNIGCLIVGVVQMGFALLIRSMLEDELGGWSGFVKFELGYTLQIVGGIVMIAAAIASIVLWNQKKKAA